MDYDSLISNHSTYDKHLNTSIHRFGVEGTPDIRNFSGESPYKRKHTNWVSLL